MAVVNVPVRNSPVAGLCATWVIGDIQGCLSDLQRLLKSLQFEPKRDRLIFAGDLINRGPQSLETLRFIRTLNADVVLGNHDLHCLAVYSGHRRPSASDTLDDIIKAPDAADLMSWLRHQHMMLTINQFVITHAGCPAEWSLNTLTQQSQAIEQLLRADSWERNLTELFGNLPDHWDQAGSISEKNRYAINALTRLRFVHSNGRLDFATKEGQAPATSELQPWFALPGHGVLSDPDVRGIIFGHWSTLGVFDKASAAGARLISLDGGCVWGGSLAAYQVEGPEQGRLIQIKCTHPVSA